MLKNIFNKLKMRFRYVFMALGSLIVMGAMLLTDPDSGFIQNLSFGASVVATLIILSKVTLYVAAHHFSRKAVLDYLRLDEFFTKAKESPTGAGLAIIGVGLMSMALAIVLYAATH